MDEGTTSMPTDKSHASVYAPSTSLMSPQNSNLSPSQSQDTLQSSPPEPENIIASQPVGATHKC